MTMVKEYYASIQVEDGRELAAKFADINARDGFEISLEMYKVNLGPVSEEVFRRFADKFAGDVIEEKQD